MNHSPYAVRVVRQSCSSSLLRGHNARTYIVNGIKQTSGKGCKDGLAYAMRAIVQGLAGERWSGGSSALTFIEKYTQQPGVLLWDACRIYFTAYVYHSLGKVQFGRIVLDRLNSHP